jgi:hypothetical protein
MGIHSKIVTFCWHRSSFDPTRRVLRMAFYHLDVLSPIVIYAIMLIPSWYQQ